MIQNYVSNAQPPFISRQILTIFCFVLSKGMWRRDGSSLLQKYLKAQDDDNDKDILFKASSVVSDRLPVPIRNSIC